MFFCLNGSYFLLSTYSDHKSNIIRNEDQKRKLAPEPHVSEAGTRGRGNKRKLSTEAPEPGTDKRGREEEPDESKPAKR